MSGRRRRFGAVRKLPSGRYQTRYLAGDGQMHSAPSTFATRDEADQFLTVVETDLLRRTWFDPNAGAIGLGVYAPKSGKRRVTASPANARGRQTASGG